MSTFGVGMLQGLNLAWAQRMKQQQDEQELAMRKEDLKLRQQILKGQEAAQQLTSTKTFLDLQQLLRQQEQQGAAQQIIAPAMQEIYSPPPGTPPLPQVAPPPAPAGMPAPTPVAPPTAPPVPPQGRPPLPVPGPAQPGGAAPKGDVEAALRLYGREQAPQAELADVTARIARLDAVEARIKTELTKQGLGLQGAEAKTALGDIRQTRDDLAKRRSELEQQQTTAQRDLRKEQLEQEKEQTPKWPAAFEGWFQNTYKIRPQDAWKSPEGQALLGQGQQQFEAEEQAKAIARASATFEKQKDKVVIGEDATRFGVPPGLFTYAELGAMGKIPLTTELQKQLFNIDTVETMVSQLDERVNRIFKDIQPGLWNRGAAAAQQAWQRLTQNNPDIPLYEARKNAFLATIAKTFGESGQLAEGDTARASQNFPVLFPVPDTTAVAKTKMKELRSLITEIAGRARKGAPTGQATPTPGGQDLSGKSTEELFKMLGGR